MRLRPGDEASYRSGARESTDVVIEERADGTLLARSPERLGAYPAHLTERLVHWARVAPDRPFLARRDAAGAWQSITFAGMLERARSVGQTLLDRGLSAARPLVILSENDLEHGTLATAAQYAGIPYAPISPAYSLVSRDFGKLKHIVGLLTPGLVYAADGERYAAAIAAAVPAHVEVAVRTRPPSGRAATLFDALLATTATPAVDAAHAAVSADTIAKFLFTSGSTREPKGVINTHRMLCSNQQVILQSFPFMAEEPLRQIVANAGAEPSVVLNKVVEGKSNFGYNAATEAYGDLVEMGVIDPTKVVRTALQNAASVAGLILTTDAMVAELPKEEKAPAMPPGGGGMDY